MPIYEKIQEIREVCLKSDWSTDKTFPKGGKMIPFVSGEKIKRTFAPLFAEHKVDLSVEVSNVSIHPELSAKQYSSTVVMDVKFILTDTEDGSKDICIVPGFAPADDLHGPKTAVSFAYNTYMTMKFQICDRTDDMVDDVDGSVISELKAKALSESTAINPVYSTEIKNEEVTNPPKFDSKTGELITPNLSFGKPSKSDSAVSVTKSLTLAEKKAVANSVDTATKWLEEGKIIESQYEEVKKMADSVTDSNGVCDLIGHIRVLKKDIGTKEVGM